MNGYNQSIPQRRQREVIETFGYMEFMGKIDMKTPEVVLGCFEECEAGFYLRKYTGGLIIGILYRSRYDGHDAG